MLPFSHIFVTTPTFTGSTYMLVKLPGSYTQRNDSIPRDQLHCLISPSFTLIHLPNLSVKSLSITIIINYS